MINISYIIIVPIKMWVLILLVYSRYGLACQYDIAPQISIYNRIHLHFLTAGVRIANL